MHQDLYKFEIKHDEINLYFYGRWTLSNIGAIERQLLKEFKTILAKKAANVEIVFHGDALEVVDTSAILMFKTLESIAKNKQITYRGFSDEYSSLSARLAEFNVGRRNPRPPRIKSPLDILEAFGRACVKAYHGFAETPQLIGLFLLAFLELLRKPFEFRFTSMVYHIQSMPPVRSTPHPP